MIELLVGLIATAYAETCTASHYGAHEHGHKMANGKPLNNNAMTAAHKELPFGRKVRVIHGNKFVIVTITDRGPFIKGRCIDLTTAAAKEIQCNGLCKVSLEH